MSDYKLILFDIDGTLLWPKGSGRASTRAAMIEIFNTDAGLDSHQFGGKTDWFTLSQLLNEHGYSEADIGRRMPTYEQAIARHLRHIIDDFAIEPCPGALELVSHLRGQDSPLLGIITGNVSTTAPLKLAAAGFQPGWFPIGAYGSEAVDRNALPFLAHERAQRLLSQAISPHEVIIVGDTLADIDCARALGAVAVAVTTGFEKPETLRAAAPDYLLDDLTAFMQVVMPISG